MNSKTLAAAVCAMLAWPAVAQELTPARKGFYSEPDATGYQFDRRLSAELGSRQLADREGKVDVTSLSVRGRYPLTEKIDLYGRANYDHIVNLPDNGKKKTVNDAEGAVGASYAVSPKADLRMETQRARERPANVNAGAGLSF